MAPKVVVGVCTFAGQKYCRKQFMKGLSQLTYPNLEFIFSTNSGKADADDIKKEAKILKNVTVIHDDYDADFIWDTVAHNREQMRQAFLKTDAEWLHIMDADIIGQNNRIEVFLADKKQLMAGWYLNTFKDTKGKEHVLPVIYGFQKGFFARQLQIPEMMHSRMFKIRLAGLGLAFAHRSIMEKIGFRVDPDKMRSDNAVFFLDTEAADFELYLDTRISGVHLKYPLKDKRNRMLDPRRYKRKSNPKDTNS